jgi:uncharacterized protein
MAKTALITGASGGIGLDFAKKFAENGYNLVLVARSEGKLKEIAADLEGKHKITVTPLAKDLSKRSAPAEVYQETKNAGIAVDVLVNNAGFANYGFFHQLNLAKELELIDLNISALLNLTHLFLPDMIARKNGKILNVASTAAFQPGPLMANYYASKGYVLYFSEALANELKGTGVTVTALCPGATASGFQERAAMTESKLVQSGLMESRTVVDIGYKGLMAGKPVVIPGFRNRVQAFLIRFLPRKMVTNTVRRVQDRVSH